MINLKFIENFNIWCQNFEQKFEQNSKINFKIFYFMQNKTYSDEIASLQSRK
jgi:hypothetical protein